MERFEYIRCYWQYIDGETPVALFYEADLQNERCATRLAEVFPDRSAEPVTELGFGFVTDAPVPAVREINQNAGFFAERISKAVFEDAFCNPVDSGPLSHPQA